MRNFIYSTLNWAWKGNPPIVFFGILLGVNCIFILQLPMYVK